MRTIRKLPKTIRPHTRTNILRGKPLRYNVAQQLRYKQNIDKLISVMIIETRQEILRLFKSSTAKEYYKSITFDESIASQARIVTNKLLNKFEQLFGKKAPVLAKNMLKESSISSKIALRESLKKLSGGLTLKTNFITMGLREIAKAVIVENVSLIKSIATQYLTNVQKAVMRSITTGNGLQDLVPALKKYEGITLRKAKNVALDQTRKAYSSINEIRMRKLGLEEFEWLHSGGGHKPRKDHIAMSGNIYRFDDLPIIDQKTKQRGKPGDAYNCGCIAVPVIKFGDN